MTKQTYKELEREYNISLITVIIIVVLFFIGMTYNGIVRVDLEKENTQLKEQLNSVQGDFTLQVRCIEYNSFGIDRWEQLHTLKTNNSKVYQNWLKAFENEDNLFDCEVLK